MATTGTRMHPTRPETGAGPRPGGGDGPVRRRGVPGSDDPAGVPGGHAAGVATAVGSVVIFAAVTIGTIVGLTLAAAHGGYQIRGHWLERWGNASPRWCWS